MTDCPNCERYKASASMWRNEAYRVAGHPLPWSPDEKLLQEALEALIAYDGTNGASQRKRVLAAIRARLEEKR